MACDDWTSMETQYFDWLLYQLWGCIYLPVYDMTLLTVQLHGGEREFASKYVISVYLKTYFQRIANELS